MKLIEERKRQFPEPMLWLIFRGLAEALYMMRTGRSIAHHEPLEANRGIPNAHLPTAPHWQPYVNTDIKLPNVVLGHSTNWYPAYKTPLMIDFGNATPTTTFPNRNSKKLQGPTRPVTYKEIGTPGERAPVSNTML